MTTTTTIETTSPSGIVSKIGTVGDTMKPSAASQCHMHAFRHVSKVGGTTVRFIFDRQTVIGEWEFPLPYGASEKSWRRFRDAWVDAARAYVNGTRESAPRALVEIRGMYPEGWLAANFESDILVDMVALRLEFAGKCALTTSYLVRNPVDMYASYYAYYVAGPQAEEKAKAHGNGEGADSGLNTWGRSIDDWAPTKEDMQTRELLYEPSCVHQLRTAPFSTVDEWDSDCLSVSDTKWSRALNLVKQFDVIGTTDRFNEFIHVLGLVAGIEDVRYVLSNAGKTVSMIDKRKLAESIRSVTTRDAALYAYANATLDRTITKLYGSVDAFRRDIVVPFEAATTRATYGRLRVGGACPTAPYKWVRQHAAEIQDVPFVQLPMWVMPNGGGQASAYMNNDPVVLVNRSLSKSIICVKGCTFDST